MKSLPSDDTLIRPSGTFSPRGEGSTHGFSVIEIALPLLLEGIHIEDFHSKSERGVKQECYAHMLLINLARIFESEANRQLPPAPPNHTENSKECDQKDSYWQDFCGEIQKLKINFKNCLLVIGRSLEKLLLSTNNGIIDYLANMLESISRVRQKIRPGRHTPRQSRKPVNKWKSSNGGPVMHA